MIVLNIADEFGKQTGFRTYDDGPKSGQEFYDTILRHKFKEALNAETKLIIYFDGGEGYTSSFINEAFRRLALEFKKDIVWNNLALETKEYPRMSQKIRKAVYESE